MSLFGILLFLFPFFILAHPPAALRYGRVASFALEISALSSLSDRSTKITNNLIASAETVVVEVITATTTTTLTLLGTTSPIPPGKVEITSFTTPASTTSVLSSSIPEAELSNETPANKLNASIDAISEAVPSRSESLAQNSSASTDIAFDIVSPSEIPAVAPSASATTVAEAALSSATVGPSPESFTGDITYFDVGDGFGSCGEHFDESEMVVALSPAIMANAKNPNDNPKCFTYITLYHPDSNESSQGKVVSTCPGCDDHDVDLSPALFNKIAPSGDGRVSGISWHFT